MDKNLQENLFREFPQLYRGKEEGIEKNLMSFGFAVGNGWYEIIQSLSEHIVEYCNENDLEVPKAFQVKEKFGQLRFYLDLCPDNNIREMIKEAEKKSGQICEVCGEEGEIRDGSWIKTLCDEHAREQGYIDEG